MTDKTPKERAYVKDTKGHLWMRNKDGSIDIFGYDADTHNGPICVKCGYGFCHHCHAIPAEDCPEERARRTYKRANYQSITQR